MAYSTDADLVELLPDILDLGISSFTEEHDKAASDIERELLGSWWGKKGISGDLDPTKLTASQFNLASCYLTLWKYALPQLTNWVDGDRFQNMITFYRSRYGEEMAAIMAAGVEYDEDGDSVVTGEEKASIGAGRLVR